MTGLQGVSKTVAQQATDFTPPDIPIAALPLVLIVANAKRNSENATVKFLATVVDRMRALRDFTPNEDARLTLHRHFRALMVVNDPESLTRPTDSLATPTLGEFIPAEAREMDLIRRSAQIAFRPDHFRALVGAALDDFAGEESLRFSALGASRIGHAASEEFPTHLRQLLQQLHGEEDIWATAVPLVASAVMLDSCPPGMHFFEPSSVFREFYFMHCLSGICSYSSRSNVRDRFMDLVEQEYEVLYSIVASEPQVCTAKQSHRNDLGPFRFIPPTAGIRMLSLDGGGIEKFGCPIQDHFDLVCGTSSGGLIILGLFFKHWSPTECLERFEQLAKKLFRRRLSGSTILDRLQEFVMSYLADCRYDSGGIEDAINETFGDDILMFNPLSNDTKVAITATTARDSSPCLFTNYNGRRRPRGTSYSVVRAEDAAHEISISDAARCTSAAPWYFRPKELKSIGTFQDGGLWLNNPLPAGTWELKSLYPERGEPDYALSIGTGTVQKSQPIFKSGAHSPVRDSFLSRLYRTFMLSMDGEKTWEEFMNTLPLASRDRYHRLNLTLDAQHISIDDVTIMDSLKSRAVRYASTGSQLKPIRDSMFAAMFYFELETLPRSIDGKVECAGNIYCRVDLTVAGRRSLYSELVGIGAFFLIDGRPVPCVDSIPACCPPFKRAIKFSLRSLDDMVRITIRNVTMQPRFISGVPRTVEGIISAQQLYAPFGRKDHTTDKSLPPLPWKRKTRSSDFSGRRMSSERR
ncbi:MAG: hypothetical protein M1828_001052 [Chrysothrix sp. TS-e1954]|nr:MAG: hypothetical protein M1828_001052 [Chrysothrix sp. TS-e1954]